MLHNDNICVPSGHSAASATERMKGEETVLSGEDGILVCPLFSVLVPAYNRAHCLAQTLDSVVAQTFGDWECVVIDDGSTDNTYAIAQRYAEADKRFRCFTQPNSGVSRARNRGIAEASGEWVCFLDSDDQLLPWALESFEAASAAQPSVDLLSGSAAMEWSHPALFDRSKLRVQIADHFPPGLPSSALGEFNIHTVAIRRSAFGLLRGFDEELITAEDTDFLLRAAALGPVASFQVPVAVICRPDAGKYEQFRGSSRRLDAELRIFRNYVEDSLVKQRTNENQTYAAQVRRYCDARLCVLRVAELLREGSYTEAAAEFTKQFTCELGSADSRLHCSRWYVHLCFPANDAFQAGRRFARSLTGLSTQLSRNGNRRAASFVMERLVSETLRDAMIRLRGGNLLGGLQIMTGCLAGHRQQAALLRLASRRLMFGRTVRMGKP